jgi:hypothetical protein
VKFAIAEDDIPLLVRALEHYAAYLEPPSGRTSGIVPWWKVEAEATRGGGRPAGEVRRAPGVTQCCTLLERLDSFIAALEANWRGRFLSYATHKTPRTRGRPPSLLKVAQS